MKPTAGDVHVNRPLTNISLAFVQDANNFVASKVFPNIPVDNKSDLYFRYNRGDFNRDQMQKRAPSTESAGGGFALDTDSYNAEVYAFHKDVDDQIRGNSDAPLNLDRDATIFATQQALIRREKLWVSKFFATSLWTGQVTGVNSSPTTDQTLRWNDAAATPIEDIEAGKTAILKSTGFKANTLVLGYEVWTALKNHPDIVDRIKYSGGVSSERPAVVGEAALAQLLGIPKILVMEAIENTGKEGQSNSHSFIGGKNALLVHAAPNPGIMIPSAGYTFSWKGYLGAGAEGNRIKRFRLEHLASDRIEIEMAFDQKLVAADLGYFFSTIVA